MNKLIEHLFQNVRVIQKWMRKKPTISFPKRRSRAATELAQKSKAIREAEMNATIEGERNRKIKVIRGGKRTK